MRADEEVNAIELLLKFYAFIARKILLITSITLIGLIIGTVSYVFEKPYYKSDMIGRSNLVSNVIMVKITNTLSEFLENQNIEKLAESMDLSIEVCKKIRKIEASTKISNEEITESEFNKEQEKDFLIKLEVLDPTIMDKVRDGMSYYFESNTYLSQIQMVRRIKMESTIKKIDEELAELDSLEQLMFASVSGKTYSRVEAILKEHSFQVDVVQLFERKQYLLEELYFLDALVIIKDFSTSLKPVKKPSRSILIFGFLFFMIGLIIAAVIELRHLLRNDLIS